MSCGKAESSSWGGDLAKVVERKARAGMSSSEAGSQCDASSGEGRYRVRGKDSAELAEVEGSAVGVEKGN